MRTFLTRTTWIKYKWPRVDDQSKYQRNKPFIPGSPGRPSPPDCPGLPAGPYSPVTPSAPYSPAVPFNPIGPGGPGSPSVPLSPEKPGEQDGVPEGKNMSDTNRDVSEKQCVCVYVCLTWLSSTTTQPRRTRAPRITGIAIFTRWPGSSFLPLQAWRATLTLEANHTGHAGHSWRNEGKSK